MIKLINWRDVVIFCNVRHRVEKEVILDILKQKDLMYAPTWQHAYFLRSVVLF